MIIPIFRPLLKPGVVQAWKTHPLPPKKKKNMPVLIATWKLF